MCGLVAASMDIVTRLSRLPLIRAFNPWWESTGSKNRWLCARKSETCNPRVTRKADRDGGFF